MASNLLTTHDAVNKSLPTNSYNNVTLVLDRPSRFDIKHNHLLAGVARDWFHDATGLHPDETEIRLATDRSDLLAGTKYIILSGDASIRQWTLGSHSIADHGYTITAIHNGQPYESVGVHNIQDCLDFSNEHSDEDEDDEEEGTGKDSAVTRRSNYPFWCKWGVKKLLKQCPRKHATAVEFKLLPNLAKVCELLRHTTNRLLYLDIEVSRIYGTLDCVGLRIDNGPVYVVPIYRYTGKLAYTNAHLFLAALSIAMQRNIVVGHNVAGFDLPYLAALYRVGFGRSLYDTMLANHRLFAEVEKSLGHVIGMWTDYPYHKDQIITPRCAEDEQRYWKYNAQDVARLQPIMEAQLEYAATLGATSSIAQVNRCIYPYVLMTLRGIKVRGPKLAASAKALEERILQLNRVARWAMGRTFNMASSKQCVEYFHKQLGYPPVETSDKTGEPKLGKKALYQLACKHDNPMIPFILGYRKLAKDASMLNFNHLVIR